jgi:hypothetical protein
MGGASGSLGSRPNCPVQCGGATPECVAAIAVRSNSVRSERGIKWRAGGAVTALHSPRNRGGHGSDALLRNGTDRPARARIRPQPFGIGHRRYKCQTPHKKSQLAGHVLAPRARARQRRRRHGAAADPANRWTASCLSSTRWSPLLSRRIGSFVDRSSARVGRRWVTPPALRIAFFAPSSGASAVRVIPGAPVVAGERLSPRRRLRGRGERSRTRKCSSGGARRSRRQEQLGPPRGRPLPSSKTEVCGNSCDKRTQSRRGCSPGSAASRVLRRPAAPDHAFNPSGVPSRKVADISGLRTRMRASRGPLLRRHASRMRPRLPAWRGPQATSSHPFLRLDARIGSLRLPAPICSSNFRDRTPVSIS